jgi:hypothetical protein
MPEVGNLTLKVSSRAWCPDPEVRLIELRDLNHTRTFTPRPGPMPFAGRAVAGSATRGFSGSPTSSLPLI